MKTKLFSKSKWFGPCNGYAWFILFLVALYLSHRFITIVLLAGIQTNFLLQAPLKSADDIQQLGNPLLVVHVTADEARMVSHRYNFKHPVKDAGVYDTIIIEEFGFFSLFLGPVIILCNSNPKVGEYYWPRIARLRNDKIKDTIVALSKASVAQAGSALEGGNAKGSNTE